MISSTYINIIFFLLLLHLFVHNYNNINVIIIINTFMENTIIKNIDIKSIFKTINNINNSIKV